MTAEKAFQPCLPKLAHCLYDRDGVPNGTLRGRLQGAKPHADEHSQEQILSVEEGKAVVRLFVALDDWGPPLRGSVVKAFAMSLLLSARRRQPGNHWLTRFLNRYSAIVVKFSQRLDCRRANASDPVILKGYFYKVFILYYITLL